MFVFIFNSYVYIIFVNIFPVCFKIFDLDRDGILDKKELVDMVGILCTVANEAIKNQGSRSSSPDGDSDGSKEFDPEVILTNLRDKLVAVQVNGRKPVFHLGPNSTLDMVILSEVSIFM